MVPVVEQFPLIVVNHCVDYSAQRPSEYTKEKFIVGDSLCEIVLKLDKINVDY